MVQVAAGGSRQMSEKAAAIAQAARPLITSGARPPQKFQQVKKLLFVHDWHRIRRSEERRVGKEC